VVSTPIGNAADLSLRALEVLRQAHVVACEDTRVTSKLLAIHGLRKSLFPYHDHNAERVRPRLIGRLKLGEIVALVADAGTPLVSDPGYKLVRAAVDEGIAVTAVPGPSAVLAALVVAGLPTDRFLFAGFLPAKAAERRRTLGELAPVRATLVFMESPRRLADALADMAQVLGARPACVARELTKLFEEARRGSLAELAAWAGERGPPKGEVTIVVAPPQAAPAAAMDLDARLEHALGAASLSEAVRRLAEETGLPRRLVYARALELKRGR
jgi:16S rRNA (cytidine1402-2'-O)-methyltransferase